MADGIVLGTTGAFAAVLELNGSPAPTQPVFAWATDIPNATVTPAPDGLSAVIEVPGSETATSITVTATDTEKSVSGAITVPLSAPQVFTVTVTQTA